jgi:hypothetical protein
MDGGGIYDFKLTRILVFGFVCVPDLQSLRIIQRLEKNVVGRRKEKVHY